MPIGLIQQIEIPASPQIVWETLHDPSLMVRCIPGCIGFQQEAENEYSALVEAGNGLVRTVVHGRIELRDRVSCKSYTMHLIGDAGFVGILKGRVNMVLEEVSGGTCLTYQGEGSFRTGLFGIELPLVPSVAAQLTDHFFQKLRAIVAARCVTVQ